MTAKTARAFKFLKEFSVKKDQTYILMGKHMLSMGHSDMTYSGKCTKHKDGTFTITRGKEIQQYFRSN